MGFELKPLWHNGWHVVLIIAVAQSPTSVSAKRPMTQEIAKGKWGWVGHTLGMSAGNIARQALDWIPQGKSKK